MTTPIAVHAYEVRNPSFTDMNIEEQIDAGINDWVCRDRAGREFFGQSKEAAEQALRRYNYSADTQA
jgi:hypothetical protein